MVVENSSYNQQFGSEKARQTTPTQEWKNGQFFKAGELVSYGSKQYQCMRDHTAQPESAPDEGYSFWAGL
ncbi:carbohydrate-binding protein [Streptomyces sp. NPDC006632]|uniref:carbohydrate-binding protein n=1 Tax=Streptomyces TaxID=1883 RepID=UPI0033BB2596